METDGIKYPRKTIPTVHFIEKIAPGFSYMTALGYVWRHEDTGFEGLEVHIDAFLSKHTTAWDIVKSKAPVNIFYKGDECNPFISCADILASYVDDMISVHRCIVTKLCPPPLVRRSSINVNLHPVRVLHYYGFAYRLVVERLEGGLAVVYVK